MLYTVRAGDTPAVIAYRLAGGAGSVADLVLANPHKARAAHRGRVTFQSLQPGERINVPEWWSVAVGLGDAPTSSDPLVDGLPSRDQIAQQGAQAAQQAVQNADPAWYQRLQQIEGDTKQGYEVGAEIGSLVPGIGTAIGGIVGAAVAFISDVAPILGGLFPGDCEIGMPNGQTDNCADYASIVKTAVQWASDNQDQAMGLSSSAFAAQASIFETNDDLLYWCSQVPPEFRNADVQSLTDQAKKLPGAYEILLVFQLPAAAALATLYPNLWPLFQQTLPYTFPALQPVDIAAIGATVGPLHQALIDSASLKYPLDLRGNPPAQSQVQTDFPNLLPVDCAAVVASWGRMIAALMFFNSQKTQPKVADAQSQFALTPDQAKKVVAAWQSVYQPPASTAAKVATGAAVVGGAGALAAFAVSAYHGVSFVSTVRGWYGLAKHLVTRR